MVTPHFLTIFAATFVVLVCVVLGVTLVIDPYGVSPISTNWDRINRLKPARINIDRQIKPIEVWQRQPKTVFLGTSRTHQGLDPTDLDGSRFAPAYNASVPANSLSLAAAQLQQYIDLDPALRVVGVELFFYQFIGVEQPRRPRLNYHRHSYVEALVGSAGLFLSIDAFWATLQTLQHNWRISTPVTTIASGGNYWVPPSNPVRGSFDAFPDGIWSPKHSREELFPQLNETAFQDLAEIVELCRKHKLELILLMLPNHAYDEYRLEYTGQWPNVAEWLRRLSAVATVYSFSQENDLTFEPVATNMKYWLDPLHMNLAMGRHVLTGLAGTKQPDTPDNFMVRLTPEGIEAHVARRSQAARRWAAANGEFVDRFRAAHRKWEAAQSARRN